MTTASDWPLPKDGIRFFFPKFATEALQKSRLSKDLFPLAMGYYPSAAGHHMSRNEHRDYLLIACVDGKGHLKTQEGIQAIGTGDILLLPKDYPHEYYSDTKTPWTIYWCHFAGENASTYLAALNCINSHSILSIGHETRIANIFRDLLEVRNQGYNQAYFLHCANQLKQLLSQLNLWLLKNPERVNDIAFDDVIDEMHRNIHAQITLEELADLSGLSKYYFSRQFKLHTGYAPVQYFIHLKMEKACLELDHQQETIEQVALSLGYQDTYYFSRIFKKVIGLSPRQYRQASRG